MDMTLAGVPEPLELLHASSLEALELNVPSSPRIWGQSPEAPGHSPLIATRAVQIQRGEYLLLQWFDDLEWPFFERFRFLRRLWKIIRGRPPPDHGPLRANGRCSTNCPDRPES